MRYLFTLMSLLWINTLAQTQEKALLWKVQHPENGQQAYVFGTIHLIPSEKFFLPESFQQAFQESQKLFTEIDLDDMNNVGKLFGIMDDLFMSDDLSIGDLLSEQDYALLKDHFDKLGLPLSLFSRMKPLMLSALTGSGGNPFALKDGSFKSYEFELGDFAKQVKKPTEGLESLEFQLSIFDSIPYPVQAQMLMESIKAPEEKMDELYKIYLDQDIEKMVMAAESDDPKLSPYLEMLIYKRNQNWVPIIEKEMGKGISFFAVGAGHLGGPKGLIQLLKNKGLVVTALH